MIRNYFKIAWRYMTHNKGYSILNIAGLTAGMAVALIIGLWIYSQYSFDRYLPGYHQLYQVKLNFDYNGDIKTQTGASLPIIDELKSKYPEVKYASETDWGSDHSFVVGEKKLNVYGLQVGTDFISMFPYQLVKGKIANVFSEPNSIVVTESIAHSLFGNEEPLNKIIRIDNQRDLVITGVLKDLPKNSTLQFSYLLPFNHTDQKDLRSQWTNYSYPEYLELKEGTDVAAFETKIRNMLAPHDPDRKIELTLQPAKNWRLLTHFTNGKATGGLIEYVRMFGIIGILILIIACINFTNLSTARSEKRALEVGVRKAVGCRRSQLVLQFLTESMLLTGIAFGACLLLVQLLLPYFNELTSQEISIPYLSPEFWAIMSGYVLLTGILAGSRPAFYLSSFKPVKVLKGSVQQSGQGLLPQRILVVMQFSCSIALIIGTLIIYQQISHVKARPKGYNADYLLITGSSDELNKNYNGLKDDLLKTGLVQSVTKAASPLSYFPASFTLTAWPGKQPEESLEMVTTAVSKDYFTTIGMKLKAGRDFEGDAGPDTMNIVLNEAAVERLKLADPLNQLITFDYSKRPMRVIGVVQNALIESPFFAVRPAIFVYNPGWAGTIMYRLKPEADTRDALAKIAPIFNRYNPAFSYSYQFAGDAFDAKFSLEVLIGKLAGIFAGLAVFISCLGLFGLAAYVAEQRKKEIGIRKVLGASVPEIWYMLSRDFVILVIISCVLATPVSYYFLNDWLQKFDYRIMIGPTAFMIAAISAIAIAIITVSYQSVKTALTNPVKSLRAD